MKQSILSLIILSLLAACSSAYYGTMEKFGVHKREILVDRVEDARGAQEEATEQFASALEQFKSVVTVEDSKLERAYNKLDGEYEDSVAAAEEISSRIKDIERVAEDLFEEWDAEIGEFSSAQLRRESRQQLNATKARYRELIAAMRKSEQFIPPVLTAMNDQRLYLKHNLNARAIQSLKGEVIKIDRDVDALLASMRSAIAEADAFIRDMKA